ncbi:MAG: ATP-binding protein, partial [Anaerolineales bacterium]|nr:ATP-binding protein [Anaerolineales bacterium]
MDVVVTVAMERVAKLMEEVEAQVVIPSTWPTAVGYAPWLVEVWVNYLTNAIKYGGRPCLITLGYDEPKDGQIRFWVEDNGRGLTTTQQAQLFTEFNRLGAEQQHVEGHGLGLTIVARIMDKLHGSAGAESEFGTGSRFYFCLPTA